MSNNKFYISNRKFLRKRKKSDIHQLHSFNGKLKDTEEEMTGKQKAAMLLRSLDSATVAELLKGIDAQTVQELAVELAHLDATGFNSKKQGLKLAQQFCNSLRPNQDFRINDFLKEVLHSSVGTEKTEQIRSGIQEILDASDPFKIIYSNKSDEIAAILEKEHPQTVAVVLSEMSATKKTEVLSFLDWGIRISIVNRMSNCGAIDTEAKKRIIEEVCKHFQANAASDKSGPLSKQTKPSLRKLAVTLRNLGEEIRDGLLGVIRRRDKNVSKMLVDLMIFWEDIPQISDRSLQKILKKIDINKLALALVKADNLIVQKIQSNISESMAAVLNEHILLDSAYEWKDIEQAREEIVEVLQEMNEKGELAFIEE